MEDYLDDSIDVWDCEYEQTGVVSKNGELFAGIHIKSEIGEQAWLCLHPTSAWKLSEDLEVLCCQIQKMKQELENI